MTTDYMQSATGTALSDEQLFVLRCGGASSFFIDFVAAYDNTIVRSKVDRWFADGYNMEIAVNRGMMSGAGHFVTALWEGDIYKIVQRADGKNRRLFRELYADEYETFFGEDF